MKYPMHSRQKVLGAMLMAMGVFGCEKPRPKTPAENYFVTWNDYAYSFCSDIEYRLPELVDELRTKEAKTKSWGAVITGGIAVAGSILTTALVAEEDAEGNAENRTAALISASSTGGASLVALVITALLGEGPDNDIKQANEKAEDIRKSLDEYRKACDPAAEPEPRSCYLKGIQLARKCEVYANSAGLRLRHDYPPPTEMPLTKYPLGAHRNKEGPPSAVPSPASAPTPPKVDAKDGDAKETPAPVP